MYNNNNNNNNINQKHPNYGSILSHLISQARVSELAEFDITLDTQLIVSESSLVRQ